VSEARVAQIRSRLQAALAPISLEVRDDSASHAGHAGAQGGAGHFTVVISSSAFNGLRKLQRHRLVYDAVADMMPNEIHALSIEAVAPQER
jgi:BolA protein